MKLIYAEELWWNIHNAGGCGAKTGSWDDGWDKAIDEAIRLIEAAPTIDPESLRPAGEWIPDDYEYYHCSECGYEHDAPEYVTPYCPNCGAKMEEST